MKIFLLILCVALSATAKATNWGETEVDDPIFKGEKCSVHEPISYGSYIYFWPSKYDQVFWPLTDQYGIWFCEKSGFTAFIGDFSGLTPNEREEIKNYLLKNPPKDASTQTKLNLLENIYSLRQKDNTFNNQLLRVLARWYQSIGDHERANNYRKKALSEIVKNLEGDLDEIQKLEYLYLAVNYYRQLGEIEISEKYISKLILSLDAVKDEGSKDYAMYLKELYPESMYIEAGDSLDPKLPE
ncbi:DUF2225 domain-containing protein [Porticoccus sp. W117]|uniref:DUF2225 domain-containing protein n=1 Tax=Porticoccus sp. W117 TaxID=3054777 RepID=UPI0025977815|nr:DUF2225 domain-containing protein [Porticoccus sp. W117]MDM3871715.1 DUF2225 domain-containing protein [Porticoccus sp. W117]